MNKLLYSISLFTCFVIATLIGSCDQERYPQGKLLYDRNCANCHMADGKGLGEIYPTLIGSSYLTTDQDALVCLIKKGKKSTQISTVYMPAHDLSDLDMINLINYLSYKLSEAPAISPQEVKEALAACP